MKREVFSKLQGSKNLVAIISHADADGIISAVVATEAAKTLSLGDADIITICEPAPNKDVTLNYLSDIISLYGEKYSEITFAITDRDFISYEDMVMLEGRMKELDINHSFIVADHHATNTLLNDVRFNNRVCKILKCTKEDSGATLAYDFAHSEIRVNGLESNLSKLESLVNATRDWDTFLWKELENNARVENALRISSLGALPPKALFTKIMNLLDDTKVVDVLEELIPLMDTLHEIHEANVQNAFDTANVEIEVAGNVTYAIICGIDFKYQSMVANKLFESEDYQHVNVVFFINAIGTISMRVKGEYSQIFNGSIAAKELGESFGFSGGGHPNASGFTMVEAPWKSYYEKLTNAVGSFVKKHNI